MVAGSTSSPPSLPYRVPIAISGVRRVSALADEEWGCVNDVGAYAGSTFGLRHTRDDQGLLVAPLLGRPHVVLSCVDLSMSPIPTRDGARVRRTLADLMDERFTDRDERPEPQAFTQDPLPRWALSLPSIDGDLEMTLALVPGKPAVILRFAWSGDGAVRLQVRPQLAMRAVGERAHASGATCQVVEVRHGEARVRPRPDLPYVCFAHEGIFVGSPDWRRADQDERGFQEDLWTPGEIELELAEGCASSVICALERSPVEPVDALLARARAAAAAVG